MSKKKQDIEVRMEEVERKVQGDTLTVNQLFIGKKMIGEIFNKGPKNFEIEMTDGYKGAGKTLDEAVELIIRQWNLHDQ